MEDFFKNWENEQLIPNSIELLACEGGCLNGPGITIDLPLEERVKTLENKILEVSKWEK